MEQKTQLDPRLNAYRPDLADRHLEGQVSAARYVEGQRRIIVSGLANLHRAPRFDAQVDTQALHGEAAQVFDESEGWAWCQLEDDGYVGYIASLHLSGNFRQASDAGTEILRVTAMQALAFAAPDIKTPEPLALPLGSRLRVTARDGNFLRLSNGLFVHCRHVDGNGAAFSDHVEAALRFVGAPYLWGGKTNLGIDCSGLVQIAMQSCGRKCPRDTYMQEFDQTGDLGPILHVESGAMPDFVRGDLLYWPGHVGIVCEAGYLLHATAHQMAVAIEPLAPALERIGATHKLRTVRRPGSALA